MIKPSLAETYLDRAIDALGWPGGERIAALDALPVPIYTTDREGLVTYWNQACVEFAGRQPQLGEDRWCVTWRIYTTSDEFMPHADCPMAVAVKQQRAIRGKVAIAERPDGSRKAFTPYPTPLFGDDGEMTGAVNMLVDVSSEQAAELDRQARHCKRLMASVCDPRASDILRAMAEGYQRNAKALRAS